MKKIFAIILAIAMCLGFAACGGKALNGIYGNEDFGYFTFNKDGTFSLAVKLDEGDICIGNYEIDDEKNIHFSANEDDFDSEFVIELVVDFYSYTYDKSSDTVIVLYDDKQIILTKTAAVSNAAKSGDAENTEDVATTEDAIESESESAITDSDSEDKFRAAVDNFLGNPVESGWAEDDSYLTLIAASNDNYYWWWAAGGGFGIIKQSKTDADYLLDLAGDEYLIISALHFEEYGGTYFEFSKLYNAAATQIKADTIDTDAIENYWAWIISGEIEFAQDSISATSWKFESSSGTAEYVIGYIDVPVEGGYQSCAVLYKMQNGSVLAWYAEDPMDGIMCRMD